MCSSDLDGAVVVGDLVERIRHGYGIDAALGVHRAQDSVVGDRQPGECFGFSELHIAILTRVPRPPFVHQFISDLDDRRVR